MSIKPLADATNASKMIQVALILFSVAMGAPIQVLKLCLTLRWLSVWRTGRNLAQCLANWRGASSLDWRNTSEFGLSIWYAANDPIWVKWNKSSFHRITSNNQLAKRPGQNVSRGFTKYWMAQLHFNLIFCYSCFHDWMAERSKAPD